MSKSENCNKNKLRTLTTSKGQAKKRTSQIWRVGKLKGKLVGRRERSILTVSLFGYLKLNNARYNCAIESAARALKGGGVGGAGWLTWECCWWTVARLTTPITVGTETNDCSDLKASIFTRALTSLSLFLWDGEWQQTANKQLTCKPLQGQRGWAGTGREGGGGLRLTCSLS